MTVTDSLLVALFLIAVVFLVLCGLNLVIELFSQAYAVVDLNRRRKQRAKAQQ